MLSMSNVEAANRSGKKLWGALRDNLKVARLKDGGTSNVTNLLRKKRTSVISLTNTTSIPDVSANLALHFHNSLPSSRSNSSSDSSKSGGIEVVAAAMISSSSDIESRLMQSNVILEAFGNAKTVRNDNSSRFGKYIKLQYNDVGRMVQARTQHFLLEKSRLVNVASEERNYHVFYQLLKGLMDTPLAEELFLRDPKDFKVTNGGNCVVVSEDVDDGADFRDLQQSLQECGVGDAELRRIWEILAALLHLGNVTVAPTAEDKNLANGEGARQVVRPGIPGLADGDERGDNNEGLAFIAELLGLTESELSNACTMHTISAANNKQQGGGIL